MEKIIPYIPFIVLGIFGLFLLFGMFWGMVRGLQKTTFRAGWIIVVAVILMFLTPIITKAVMDIELPFLSMTIDGVEYNTLNQLAEYGIKQIPTYGELIASNPDTLDIMVTLVTLLINAFIFVLLFWATKIVLWPVWAIIAGIFFKKKDKNGNKKPKYRLLGTIVGGVLGLLVGATTLMPVLGVVNIVSQIEDDTYGKYTKRVVNEETGEEEEVELEGGEFSKLGLEKVIYYINIYDKSIAEKLLKYTGIEGYTNLTFDLLSTAIIDDEKVVLRNEVKNVVLTVGSINTLTKMNFDNLTQQKVRELITAAKTLVNQVFNIKSITALGNSLFETVLTDIAENPNSVIKLPSTGEELFDEAINDGVTDLKDFTFSAIKNELLAILNIAEIANEKDIICKVVNKEVTETQQILALFDTETVNGITDQIFSMRTMSTFLPIVVNTGIEYLAKSISAEGFQINDETATAEEVKELFKTMTNTVFAIANSLDMDSKYYITDNTLPLAGKLLDAIKNYGGLDAENYAILMNAVEDKLYNMASKALEDFDEDMEGIKNNVLSAINNLGEVTSFETEFNTINGMFDPIIEIMDGMSKEEKEIDLAKAGKVLDALKSTQLFGNKINSIMQSGIDFAKTVIPEDFSDLTVVVERVKTHIPSVTNWETELGKLTGLVDVARKIFDSQDLKEAILAEDSTILTDLGKELDTLDTSVLFGGEIKNIVKTLINQLGDFSSDNEDMLTSSVNQIKANLENATNINWEKEFGVIKTLINSVMDLGESENTSEQIAAIGATLDDVLEANSVLVDRKVINKMVEAAIDQFAGDIEAGSDMAEIVATIKGVITTVETISFEQELKCLNDLLNDISDINADTLNFATFGAMLDSYDIINGTKKSVCVTAIRPKIVKMVINKVDTSSMDDDMVTIVEKIKTNVDTITNYEAEFTYLDDFVDTVDGLTEVDIDTFDFAGFGAKLDSYASSKLLGPIRADVLTFVIDRVEITNEKADIQTAINNILLATKQSSTKVNAGTLTYAKVFTDLDTLTDLTDSFNTVTVSRTNTTAITDLGTKLNTLNGLCIVPQTESARIAKYITNEILGPNGVQSIVDETYRSHEVVGPVYTEAISDVTALNTKYTNYISNPTADVFDYAADFEIIADNIEAIDAALTAAGI